MTDQAAARQWDTAVATGLIRIGAGVLLLRRRDMAIRLCGGSPSDPLLRTVFTFWGVRDLTLGVAALAATRPTANVPRTLAQQGIADTVDTGIIVGLIATERLPRSRGAGAAALAAGTALGEYATAWRLRRAS
jgi:hypothetical protein